MAEQGKTLIVGLGNPILSDDGIGWHILAALRAELGAGGQDAGAIDLREVAVGGLALAELMAGYQRVIVVDAIMTAGGVPGAVYTLTLDDLPGTLNTASTHDTNLVTALRTLRRYGAPVPADGAIAIVAVEVRDVWTFAEQCSPEVMASIPEAVARVRALL